MNIKEIKEIVALMNESGVTEFVIEREGFKLSIKKGGGPGPGEIEIRQSPAAAVAEPPIPPAPPAAAPAAEFITSPMVGTYYASPSPDAPSYVNVGQEVEEDTVVCIIEAMKVMNEIKAERKGKILEVLAENGEAVEFGKRLFRIG